MTAFSVAAWNLHQAVNRNADNMAATWRYLQEEVRPSVALIQESASTPEAPGGSMASPTDGAGYETSLMVFEGRLEPLPEVRTIHSSRHRFTIASSVPGAFVAARVADLPGVEPFVAVSQYGIMAPVYAQTSVLRVIADLIPLFDSKPYRSRVVLGGDLNVYDQAPDRTSRERWTAILAMYESLGLVNLLKLTQSSRGPLEGCPCRRPDCWHAETFRHVTLKKGDHSHWTNDYLFATKPMADQLTGLEIWNDRDEAWALSDHCPLVARFEA